MRTKVFFTSSLLALTTLATLPSCKSASKVSNDTSLVDRSQQMVNDMKRISSLVTPAADGLKVVEVKNYFVRNDVSEYGTLVFDSETAFSDYFGMATTMAPNGKPTEIDFRTQRVICISCAPTTDDVRISFEAITLQDDVLHVVYTTTVEGSHPSYTTAPCEILAVSGAQGKKVVFEKKE